MRTIVLATQKGGSGKSTLAIGLAVAAMQDGERVVVLEADRQGTVANWHRRRARPEPAVETIAEESALARTLQGLAGRDYTLAIIDTPATNNAATLAAVRA